MNDQLMYLERAFIDPLGLPGRPFYRLVTWHLFLWGLQLKIGLLSLIVKAVSIR